MITDHSLVPGLVVSRATRAQVVTGRVLRDETAAVPLDCQENWEEREEESWMVIVHVEHRVTHLRRTDQ